MNVKNTATGKREEAFNFLKDNLLNLTIIKDDDIEEIMSMSDKINVSIIGATGYTGLDLVLLLSKHPKVNQKLICNKKFRKKLNFLTKELKKLPKISSIKLVNWKTLDLVFLSLPNGEAQKIIKTNYSKFKNLKFIIYQQILEFQI